MASLLIKDPAQIVSPRPGVLRGAGLGDLMIRNRDSVYVENGIIAGIGPPGNLALAPGTEVLDATGKALIPGLVDCHTHLVFGGDRADEFALRTAGASYAEIAAKGGGIACTVQATRWASKDELLDKAAGYLQRAMRQGVTTMEVKSGYGLDLETELKLLMVINQLDSRSMVDLLPTFLGAHSIPPGMDKMNYLDQLRDMLPRVAQLARFCDVFCEKGYFSPSESLELLELARQYGMQPRMHADQFNAIGCVDIAIQLGALSVDHLEVMAPGTIPKLAATGVVGVVLPGVSLFLDIAYAPARAMIDAGCIVAIATDFNPGSNMCLSMPLMMSLACMKMGVSVPEALACATQNAAFALGLDRVGCIETGWQADLLLLDTDNYQEMFYFYGEHHVHTVIKKGVAHVVG